MAAVGLASTRGFCARTAFHRFFAAFAKQARGKIPVLARSAGDMRFVFVLEGVGWTSSWLLPPCRRRDGRICRRAGMQWARAAAAFAAWPVSGVPEARAAHRANRGPWFGAGPPAPGRDKRASAASACGRVRAGFPLWGFLIGGCQGWGSPEGETCGGGRRLRAFHARSRVALRPLCDAKRGRRGPRSRQPRRAGSAATVGAAAFRSRRGGPRRSWPAAPVSTVLAASPMTVQFRG